MSAKVLSINTLSASRDNFNGSIKLQTMKRKATMKTMFRVLCGLGCWWLGGGTMALAGEGVVTHAAPVRVGIYDSRAVAYAWFCSARVQQKLQDQMAAAQAAKQSGATTRFQELAADLRQMQDEMHREVFSTAPSAGALAAIKERIPEIEKQAGVVMFVSKWDQPALNRFPDAEKTDVTDRLVREFKPTEKQLKVIADLQKKKPLSLEKCNELIRQGEI